MIAKIAVAAATFAIDKPYSYRVPPEMELCPGLRVTVPFGKGNRRTEGVVLSLSPGEDGTLKTVERKLDQEPLLSETMLRLAAFHRERYFCTFYDAVRAMLPAGLWFRVQDRYRLTEDRSWETKPPKNPHAAALLRLLTDLGGEGDGEILRGALPSDEDYDKAMAQLLRKKWIRGERAFFPRSGDKTELVATLSASREEVRSFLERRTRSAGQQRAVLELLCDMGSVSVKELCYFTGAKPATVKRLAELELVSLTQRNVLRCRQIRPAEDPGPLELTPDQQAVYEALSREMERENPKPALLYGVTGSGKTSVYLKLIARCLETGKNALLLVPEIALTPQLLSLLAAYFGDQVAVLHSSLPAGERYDQWKRVRAGQAPVVVGTRSAVYAPCPKLGLIVMDEEQEHSYRSENAPRYSAREIALWRGAKEGALVLLGSATPSVETMYRAKTGALSLYTLPQRYNGRALPQVRIVDMAAEIRSGNDTSLSAPLREALLERVAAGEQTILFLNRRGNSRALVCVNCGHAPECPRCSARLTYHSANGRLMCHYCGFSRPAPSRCPDCGGPLKRIGTGTQKVQEELSALLPETAIDRMDADTVSAVNTHEKILTHFSQDRVPVLLGTQMVAKGLNLPGVTLVGVLDGDLSLYGGGYRAAETTFNMLTQVVGRAGRGDAPGEAILQTMQPEHPVIALAAKQDYDGFYELEIQLRQRLGYPPFGDLAVITFTGQEEDRVLHGAQKLRDSLVSCLSREPYRDRHCGILGPAPCPVPKINYHFRYRLTLRCRMDRDLRALLASMLRQFGRDGENRGVTAFVDVNGFD